LVDHHLFDLGYGVTLFFTLSGFLLYRPFASAILQGSRQLNLLNYLKNRALRILPGYWAVLLFCALGIGGLFLHSGGGLVDGRLTDPSLLLRAALLVQNYDPRTMLTGIGPAWSLAVEVVFYLILPLLAWLAWRLGRARGRSGRVIVALAPPALLLFVGLAGKAIAAFVVPTDRTHGWGTDWHSVLEYSFVGQADLFSFGMALAILHYFWREGRLRLPRHSHLVIALGALGCTWSLRRPAPLGANSAIRPYNT
jgi:peptidoglycan/LPS O-acetylase OafA/YrhL